MSKEVSGQPEGTTLLECINTGVVPYPERMTYVQLWLLHLIYLFATKGLTLNPKTSLCGLRGRVAGDLAVTLGSFREYYG